MSNMIFVLDRYFPEVDANVVCTKNVIDYLLTQGHSITCVCGTSDRPGTSVIDGVRVIRVTHKRYDEHLKRVGSGHKKRLLMLLHFIKSALALPVFPLTEIKYYLDLRKKIEEIGTFEDVDCVVGVFRPYETIHAALRFGEMNNKAKSIGYYLDILSGADKPFGAPAKYYYWMCNNRERKVFKRLDCVLMAKNGKSIYQTEFFDCVKNKIKYVDFPTLVFKNENHSIEKGVFIYAGSTNGTFRNPLFTIKALTDTLKRCDNSSSFHMYGGSTIENQLRQAERESGGVFHYHGKVLKEEADRAIDNAEFLVNIGNADSVLIPSKIFELFAQGKPIIHFAKDNNDSVIQYMNQYPNACIVIEDEGLENAIDRISKFIKKQFDPICEEELTQIFSDALPETVAKQIESVIL